jgi:hypothetical protein
MSQENHTELSPFEYSIEVGMLEIYNDEGERYLIYLSSTAIKISRNIDVSISLRSAYTQLN